MIKEKRRKKEKRKMKKRRRLGCFDCQVGEKKDKKRMEMRE